MDIGAAVQHLNQGMKVQREGWNGKGMFLFRVDNGPDTTCEYHTASSSFEAPEQPYIAMYTAQGTVVPWLCSQTDLLAEDWQVVVEVKEDVFKEVPEQQPAT